MAEQPVPMRCYAVVVARRGDKFLLVHERKHGQKWSLPAGRVLPGKTFASAARHEVLKEAGVQVKLMGILRVEHIPGPKADRLRVVFLAVPLDDAPPKSVPDRESLGAAWVGLTELADYPLRDPEVLELLEYAASGGPVHPPSLLQLEDMPAGPDSGGDVPASSSGWP